MDVKLSVVVPVLNEEACISSCIEHVLAQGDFIHEMIVVDNNSTDGTVEIIESMQAHDPRVRLIRQPIAGLAHARYAGFDAAEAPLIAGIDADTVVLDGWARSISAMFDKHPTLGAGTGPAAMHDLPLQTRFRRSHDKVNARAARRAEDGSLLQISQVSGANTAIRSEVWRRIHHDVSYRNDIFEDLDLSILTRRSGHRVAIIPGMRAEVSGRRMLSNPVDFTRYIACVPRTHWMRGNRSLAALCSLAIIPSIVQMTLLLPINRAWDPRERKYSLARLRAAKENVRQLPVGAAERR